jgi:hypothetical protein
MNDTITDITVPNPVPITTTIENVSDNIVNSKMLYIDTSIEARDRINDSDSECPSPMTVSNINPYANKIGLEQLTEYPSISHVKNNINVDGDSDLSDHDDDEERSMPIPISFVSVSQVSGGINNNIIILLLYY